MPPLGKPRGCTGYHCDVKNKCYSDYYPHFPTDTTLTGRIVGKTNWFLVGAKPSEGWHGKYGYRDMKPYYQAMLDKPGNTISVMLSVNQKNFAWICGTLLDSENVKFYLDQDGQKNVKENGAHKEYTFDKTKTTEITKISMGTGAAECRSLDELPKGDHVLTLVPLKTEGKEPAIHRILEW